MEKYYGIAWEQTVEREVRLNQNLAEITAVAKFVEIRKILWNYSENSIN